jgi:uncharacterized protein (DUF1778 family)
MDAEKTVAMSFRVTPRTKRLLAAAADHERRSLTNMVEVLVEDFCKAHSISDQAENSPQQRATSGGTESE